MNRGASSLKEILAKTVRKENIKDSRTANKNIKVGNIKPKKTILLKDLTK